MATRAVGRRPLSGMKPSTEQRNSLWTRSSNSQNLAKTCISFVSGDGVSAVCVPERGLKRVIQPAEKENIRESRGRVLPEAVAVDGLLEKGPTSRVEQHEEEQRGDAHWVHEHKEHIGAG